MNTQDSRLKVLLVEDNLGDFRLIQEMFKESGANVELKWAKQLSTGLANLKEESFDGLLVDLGLSDSQGIDTFKKIHDQAPQIPIVVITGLADDGLAMRAVGEGAQDYLIKGQTDSHLLIRAIRHAIERKRAEEALRESEEKYRTILENIEEGYFEVDIAGNFTFFNDSLSRLLGYSRDEMMGMNNRQYTDEENAPKLYRAFNQVYSTGEPTKGFDWEVIRKDGAKRYVETSVSSIKNSSGQPIGFRGIVRDITERKRAEEALAESEERYRQLFEAESDAIVLIDNATGCILEANSAAAALYGYSKEELLSKKNSDLSAEPEETQRVTQTTPVDVNRVVTVPLRFHRKQDGSVFPVEITGRFLIRQGRSVHIAAIRDITERKQAEEELRNSQEQFRALSARIQFAREEERTQIAREIHDELGQELTGLKMDLSWLIKRLPKNQESLISKTESMLKLVDSTIQTVRRISSELRPGVLDDLGLIAGIEWQTQDFENRSGIPCDFISSVEEIDLDRDRSTAVFRILQETLTNVSRHAKATQVKINLEESADSLILRIEDNGKGIKESEVSHPKSLGLLGMRERVLVFGGKVIITGEQGKGTTVTVKIPLMK